MRRLLATLFLVLLATLCGGAVFTNPQITGVATTNVAAPTGNAGADTANVQAALNSGAAQVLMASCGTYNVNAPEIISSNTTLTIMPCVSMAAVKGGAGGSTVFQVLQNKNYNSTPLTITAISGTLSSGNFIIVTVTFSAPHGLLVGGYLQIKGDPFEVYNGIWQISTVPTGSSLTFLMTIAGNVAVSPPFTTTGVTSASQTVANPGVFTAAGNLFPTGMAVQISGTPPGGFSTATTYYVVNQATAGGGGTFQLAVSPYAAQGIQVTSSSSCTITPNTIIGAAADANIVVTGGGTINQQYTAQGFSLASSPGDNITIFRRVRSLVLDNLQLLDGSQGHGVLLQDDQDPLVRNIFFNTSYDGVHIYGRTTNPVVENISGTLGNDGVIVQPVDSSTYTNLMVGSGADLGGDIFNATLRNIRIRHAHNTGIVAIYPNGNTGAGGVLNNAIYRIRGKVLVDGASATDPCCNDNASSWNSVPTVAVGNGYTTVASPMDSLEVRSVYGLTKVSNNASPQLTINTIILQGSTGDSLYGDKSQLFLDWVAGNSVLVSGVNSISSQGDSLVQMNSSNVSYKSVTIAASYAQVTGPTTTTALLSSTGATLGVLNLIGDTLGPGAQGVAPSTYGNTPTLNVIGGYGASGYKNLIENSSNTQNLNINVFGFTSISPTQGMFNFYGSNTSATAVYNVNTGGVNVTGTLWANQTGGTYNVNNPDGSMNTVTTGAKTASFTAANKPGTNNVTTPATWLPITVGGTQYYIPLFGQ